MSTFVDCPSCGRQMHVSDDLVGSRLRCPACDSTFEPNATGNGEERPKPGTPWSMTPNAPPEAPPPLPPASSIGGDETHEDDGDEDERPWERPYREESVRRDCEPHRGTVILILGICSLVLPIPLVGLILGVLAIVMGRTDLKKMEDGAMDPQGKGSTLAGWICGIIGTIFQALYLLYFVFIIVVYVVILLAVFRSMPPPGGGPNPPVPPPPPPKLGRLHSRDQLDLRPLARVPFVHSGCGVASDWR